ncbi:hypothetical protein CRYUN_Cryun02cG0204400 [Craigia yunnanensis]
MVIGPQRKYYFLGGKGGVGKTSCAVSLAVKFADHGHPTIVISTDHAHSLSDSFAQIDPEKAKEDFCSASQNKDLMNSMGLGMLADQVDGHTLRLLSLPYFLDASIGKVMKVMAINESSRLHASLRKECIPVQRLIVNQILPVHI